MSESVHNKLSHLSSEQIENLVARYHQGEEKLIELINEYEIDVQPSGLHALLPPIVHEYLFCPHCEGINLVTKQKSRTSTFNSQIPTCPSCGHQDLPHCRCDNCKQHDERIRREIEQGKRDAIHERYIRDFEVPEVQELSLRDAVFIEALSRHFVTEDLAFIDPFVEKDLPLAPLFEFKNEIVKHLYAKELITICPRSPTDAFEFDSSNTSVTAYFPTRVLWEFLPGLASTEKRRFLRGLRSFVKQDDWPDNWKREISDLWHQIAKYECLQYFLYLLEQRDFIIDKIGEKSHSVFEVLLEDYAVSQVFNISWMAVRDTTDYIVKEGIPTYHGKNMFIGAVERKADRARAEGWDIRHSRRDYNCPQSVISATFFNHFLELGDKAFESVPPPIL